ncbi:hypothetical protein LUZ60_012942 [Juncus effusus]|nr:hypothetical protein LUZ60_012942 [Juncus effusus]
MSYVFRGSRGDIEAGFPDFISERRPLRIHSGRTVNSNSMAFLVTVFLLFMILNSHQMFPNFLLWFVLGVFVLATILRMMATCQQIQARANAHQISTNNLLSQSELRLHVPISARGRMHSLRLNLALLDREFDDLDYDALRALDSDNSPNSISMSEEEINALPVHEYSEKGKEKESGSKGEGKSSENNELTCSVCLEQVNVGELLRTLPCLHQFHVGCIDPWLRQQGTCPVCKHRVVPNGENHDGASFNV